MKSISCLSEVAKRNMYLLLIALVTLSGVFTSCEEKDEDDENKTEPQTTTLGIDGEPFINPQYNSEQTVSDEAQRNTIAFDALGFMTGNLGAQTFLPPGKVADYSGFQYFRDNDQTKLGHNTSFVTLIANNVLNILTDEQLQMFIDAANSQIDMINTYAYKRFPLCKAFRQLMDNKLPEGKTELDLEAVKAYSAELYKIDGQISYDRAKLFGEIISSLTDEQKAQLQTLYDLEGVGNWPSNLTNKLKDMGLEKDVNVAVMTYASEIYAWYAGSVTADVYFCPERQGTYFGSFYLKDWPAMGNPDYTIDEQLTANAGQTFFDILTTEQYDTFVKVVSEQNSPLLSIVSTREEISTELRKFLTTTSTASEETVLTLSEKYGEYDGEIIYLYAKYFSEVYHSLSDEQKAKVTALADNLGYVEPSGAFLYSEPISMPEIESTDFLFK